MPFRSILNNPASNPGLKKLQFDTVLDYFSLIQTRKIYQKKIKIAFGGIICRQLSSSATQGNRMVYDRIFWLHIKKSGGITTRSLLKPYYVEVDRSKRPGGFLQANPEEYNDILNNYRILLGKYQGRRCLFAKTYLYPERWENLFSFAFSRDPIDRCISMFYSLYWQDKGIINRINTTVKRSVKSGKFHYSTKYAFDLFLDYIQKSHSGNSTYYPLGVKFSTHTASMWEDITDLEGNILLKKVFRLDNLADGINQAFEECGIEKRVEKKAQILNANKNRLHYQPTRGQIKMIESIFEHDFEIYENAA